MIIFPNILIASTIFISLLTNAGAETFKSAELNISLKNVTISTKSDYPSNFRRISESVQVRVVGRGVQDKLTGEVISLVCLDPVQDECREIQPGSLVKNTLFVFGKRMHLAEATKSLPAAFFEKDGWNWSSKPETIETDRFYRLKKTLARRELKDFEKHGEWGYDNRWLSLGKRGCLADVKVDLDSVQMETLMFDAQVQAAELFAQRYICADRQSVLRISSELRETVSQQQLGVMRRLAKRGSYIQFTSYPYNWKVSLTVINGSGATNFKKEAWSPISWSVKNTIKGAFRAHDLLFQLIESMGDKDAVRVDSTQNVDNHL